MTRLLIATLTASVLIAGCGTSASDNPDGETSTTVTTTTTTKSAAAKPKAAAPRPAAFRDITIPSGTMLQLSLTTAVASDTSHLEDSVSAEITSPVIIDGRTVVPAGADVDGVVTGVDDSGRVKGRAYIAFDFRSLEANGSRYALSVEPVSRLAPATKGEDATKVGIGAGAGAIIGGILGGKKGAAQGAAVGGGAGAGVVLATKGREIRLANGTDVSTQLTAPLTIRVSR
ncbi:MAG: hypothetical protein AB7I25_10970 [Vicinamibacterales bacterium]